MPAATAPKKTPPVDRKFVTVDVFTDHRFGGNPLAVVLNGVNILERVGVPTPEAVRVRFLMRRQIGHLSRLLDEMPAGSVGPELGSRRRLDAVRRFFACRLSNHISATSAKVGTAAGETNDPSLTAPRARSSSSCASAFVGNHLLLCRTPPTMKLYRHRLFLPLPSE